jgi:hypothetical protein
VSSTGSCLLISDRRQDVDFTSRIAERNGWMFHHMGAVKEAREFLVENPETIVFWDMDHPQALNAGHVLSYVQVAQMLMKAVPAEQVFSLIDNPLNETPHFLNFPAFGHHVFRQYDAAGQQIIAGITDACLRLVPFGASRYLPIGAHVQKVTLKKSNQRGAAIEAISNVLTKKSLPPRLISLAAQATDEMLMNAIFDAPVDDTGNQYRRQVERTDVFDLKDREVVTLEIGLTPAYMVISVTDRFGSLERDAIMASLRKAYQKQKYQAKGGPSAGLGVYGMIQSGLSLVYICAAKRRTQAVLFVPMVTDFKSFRTSFRFFSVVAR